LNGQRAATGDASSLDKGLSVRDHRGDRGIALETATGMPLAGAMRESVTSMVETPPGAIVDGLSVNDAIGGAGGSVPPGVTVMVLATGTSCRETPCASV